MQLMALLFADSNHRYKCKKVMDKAESDQCWFGIEQEYMMFDKDGHPLGWPKQGYPAPMGETKCFRMIYLI